MKMGLADVNTENTKLRIQLTGYKRWHEDTVSIVDKIESDTIGQSGCKR